MSQRFLLIIVSVGIVAAFAECNAQDFWQLTDGVSGTGLYSMAIDNHGHYYAGMADNLYRSTDNGNTWIKLSYTVNGGNRFPYEIEFLAIDSSGNIYAVVDSLIEHPYPYGETVDLSLYGSTDEGKSWVSRTQQWWTAGVGCIMIDKNQNIYVGRGDGLYESTNNGMNWISLTSQPIMSSFISRSGEIYAGTVGGYSTGTIIKSTDGGNNWHLIDSGYTSGGVFCFTENSRGDIFAGTYNGAYRTTNEGNEWQKLDLNDAIYSIVVDAHDYLYAGTYDGVLRSTNNGQTWDSLNSGLSARDNEILGIDSAGYLFAVAWDNGIFPAWNLPLRSSKFLPPSPQHCLCDKIILTHLTQVQIFHSRFRVPDLHH